jgi:hypothetical protein
MLVLSEKVLSPERLLRTLDLPFALLDILG